MTGIFGEVALQFAVDVRERELIMGSEYGEHRLNPGFTGKCGECGRVVEHYSCQFVFAVI